MVPDGAVADLLATQRDQTRAVLADIPEDRAGYRYADDKWSIKELVGHINDTERVFAARALHFARAQSAPLPGMDQHEFVAAAASDHLPLSALTNEFHAVREATLALVRNLPPEAWDRRGVADGVEFTVRAVAYIIAGHELHHRGVLEERYLGRTGGR